MNKACRMLEGGESAARVALDTGFFDQSHFIKEFKKRTGVTPGNFIRGNKPGNG